MIHQSELQHLQKLLMREYVSYKAGLISEKEYRIRAEPIDYAVDKLEMAILRDTLFLRETDSLHSPIKED